MGVVTVFTTHGQIVGERVDVVETFFGDGKADETKIRLKNPVLAILNGTVLQFVPLTQTVQEKEFDVNPDTLIFAGVFTPLEPILNKYRELFGGVQTYGAEALSMLATAKR